jgi:hypothetical protein
MSSIIDPKYQHQKITLIPSADPQNPDLKDYPRDAEGTFLQVIVEVTNGTEDNWVNSTVTPILPPELKNTKVEMSYVACPRPLVPASVDPNTGEIIQGGDDLGAFRAGWRFNQPEGEVLLKMGNKLPLMQPTRRGYFVFLFNLDESLEKGVYYIGFDFTTNSVDYTNKANGTKTYEVPPAMFSITKRNSSGTILDYQKMVVGKGSLNELTSFTTNYFKPTGKSKWSYSDINNLQFDTLQSKLNSIYNSNTKQDLIDLSKIGDFPTPDRNRIYVLEQGETYSFNNEDKIVLTDSLELVYSYNDNPVAKSSKEDDYLQKIITSKSKNVNKLSVTTFGPKLKIFKRLSKINGIPIQDGTLPELTADKDKEIALIFEISNLGNDIAENVNLKIVQSENFEPIANMLPKGCSITNGNININASAFRPGEIRNLLLYYKPSDKACLPLFNNPEMINQIEVSYKGSSSKQAFSFPDNSKLDFPAIDIQLEDLKLVSNEIKHNSLATVSTKIQNGIRQLNNVSISLFTIVNNKDTVKVKDYIIDTINPNETTDVLMNFMVPDNATYLESFAVIDADGKLCEICENNNAKTNIVPILGPYWIQKIVLSPNPVKDKLNLSYYLPREMRNLQITFFDNLGRDIYEIQNIPCKYGINSFDYLLHNYAKGSYMYKIEGVDVLGETMKFFGKFIVD